VFKRGIHLSYPPHKALPKDIEKDMFSYCGRANGGKALYTFHNTHRWSRNGDQDVYAFCVKPVKVNPKKKLVTWRHYDWYKVRVNGEMNGNNILKACRKYGYKTPCDHKAYKDANCVVVNWHGHMSHNSHQNFPRKVIDRVFFYAANANRGKTLMNYRNTHRWSNKGDINGVTMCVKREKVTGAAPKKVATKNDWEFYKTFVPGHMTSTNIYNACKKASMLPACNHPSYADGKCVAVFKRGYHLSYPPHRLLPRAIEENIYTYCGRANSGRSLYAYRNTHRWSNNGDQDGYTFCVKHTKVDPKTSVATWKGYKWYKVQVQGTVNSSSIKAACDKYGYKTPCDHKNYYDGKCTKIAGFNGHLSYSRHHDFPRSVIDRSFFYCGRANGYRALQNYRYTHRWSNRGDVDGVTLCMKK